MNEKIGTKFSLWGGSIWGTNTEVVIEKKLVQDWYSDSGNGKWEKASTVTFELHEEKGGVRIDLTHKDVPEAEIKSIGEGWKDYYLGPLKEYLEK